MIVPGLKAYIATGYNEDTKNVILNTVNEISAGTGLLLKGSAGTYDIPITSAHAMVTNMFVGTLTQTTISPTEDDLTNFVLSNSTNGIGFYTISKDMVLGANKAYLQIPTDIVQAGVNVIGFEFGDDTNGINAIKTTSSDHETWYTLDGRKLDSKPTERGIYVTRGRKVLIK